MTATAAESVGLTVAMRDRIRRHREEVARPREEFPNPAAALSAWVLENFELAALVDVDGAVEADEDDLDAW